MKTQLNTSGVFFNNFRLNPTNYKVYNQFFIINFWFFFKRLYTKSFGLMTLNTTKSSLYIIYKNLVTSFRVLVENSPVHVKVDINSLHNVKYLQPLTIVGFSFQKQTYNTLMFYVLFNLVTIYNASRNFFKLQYSFIFLQPNFHLYPFLNLFYFKLRNF